MVELMDPECIELDMKYLFDFDFLFEGGPVELRSREGEREQDRD